MTVPEFLAMRQRAIDGFEQHMLEDIKTSDATIDDSLMRVIVAGYRYGFDEATRLLESGPDCWPEAKAS